MSYNQIPIDANGFVTTTITSSGDIIDIFNSNTTPLLANTSFTGSWVNTLNYSQIVVSSYTDQIGNLQIQYSTDGINVDHVHTYVLLANIGENIQNHTHSKFYRIIYTNGNVNQSTFRLQSILRTVAGNGTIIEADDVITGFDDCVLTKSIITGQSLIDGKYVNAKMTPEGALTINQDIQIDALNSSTANLASGAFFTGATVSNITASMIQIFLKTDQNCIVYLDQSQDGINFDISDSYEYYAAIGNFGINVGAFGAYYRIRIRNIGTATTTYFRLQAVIVPIANQLPRSLSPDGWLQTAVNHTEDDAGFVATYTPVGETITAPTFKLVGSVFPGSVLDTAFWTANIGTGGVVGPTNGTLQLFTGTTANNVTSLTSVYNSRYIAGYINRFRGFVSLPDIGTANNTRRWGAYTPADGIFFELSGTTLSFVTRKAGVDTKVQNGTFNGIEGNFFPMDTAIHQYEIVYTSTAAWYFIDNELLHTSNTNISYSSTLNLPITIENFNANGAVANVSMNATGATITRHGSAAGQPISKFQSAITAGTLYKIGAGSLHSILISGIGNNANVTLYDSTTASGTIIWSSGAMAASTIPYAMDLKGVVFSTGLTLSVATAGCFVTTIFD